MRLVKSQNLRCHSGGMYRIHSFDHDQIYIRDLESDLNAWTCALQLALQPLSTQNSTARRTPIHTRIHRTQLHVSAQLANRNGFREAQFLDVKGSSQLLTSSHLRERSKNVKIHPVRRGLDWFSFGEGQER